MVSLIYGTYAIAWRTMEKEGAWRREGNPKVVEIRKGEDHEKLWSWKTNLGVSEGRTEGEGVTGRRVLRAHAVMSTGCYI